jgi:hypothetical protein
MKLLSTLLLTSFMTAACVSASSTTEAVDGDSAATGAATSPEQLAALLRREGFQGEVLVSATDRAPYARDYGRGVAITPKLVVKPLTTDDAAVAVRVARRARVSIRNRGGGHGLEGQALNDGIVLATDKIRLPSGERMELVTSPDGTKFLRAAIGVKVGELGAFLGQQQPKLRVRTSTMDTYPGLGGALAVGGIGQGSHRYGSLVDQVADLRGVTGAAKVIHARSTAYGANFKFTSFAPGEDGEAADAMLGGMGQFGVVTEVTIPVVAVQGELLMFTTVAASRDDLINKLEAASTDTSDKGRRTTSVYGLILPDPGGSGAILNLMRTVRDVLPEDGDSALGVPPPSYPDPGDPATRPDVHPAWLDLVNPTFDAARAMLASQPELITDLTNAENLPGSLVLLIPQKKVRESATTLNRWKNAQVGSLMLTVGVFYYQDPLNAPITVEALRDKRAKAIAEHGAQPYFMDGVPEDAAAWKQALGENTYRKVLGALRRHNPGGVFQPFPGLDP